MLQIDEDLTARVNMADYKFTFHEKGKEYNPAWIAPEGQWLHVQLVEYNPAWIAPEGQW